MPEVAVGTALDASPHVLVIADSDGERRFTLGPDAVSWRGGLGPPNAVRAGDPVVVRTRPGRRNVADKVWAAIGRVTGTIVENDSGTLLVDEGRTKPRQAVVISSHATSRIQVRFPQLAPGNLVDVIGMRRGPVLEALVPATTQPAFQARTVSAPAPAASRAGWSAIDGSATWHEDHGGSGAAGVAYPAVDPGTGCAEAAAAAGEPCSGLPYLAVGSRLLVRNECSGASSALPVTSCGAVARLFCDRCLACGTSPRVRVADLDPVSFVALGGDLERGCFNASISAGW